MNPPDSSSNGSRLSQLDVLDDLKSRSYDERCKSGVCAKKECKILREQYTHIVKEINDIKEKYKRTTALTLMMFHTINNPFENLVRDLEQMQIRLLDVEQEAIQEQQDINR